MCSCPSHVPYWGPGQQPRYVPWLGIELVTLWFIGLCSIDWATPARAKSFDNCPTTLSFSPGNHTAWAWGKATLRFNQGIFTEHLLSASPCAQSWDKHSLLLELRVRYERVIYHPHHHINGWVLGTVVWVEHQEETEVGILPKTVGTGSTAEVISNWVLKYT